MPDVLGRPRLLHLLHQRWDAPVTAIVAGAGFGKSTVINAALDERPSKGDERSVTFGPGTGPSEVVRAFAEVWALGTEPGTLADAAPWLASAWWRHSPRRVCTFVDNAHALNADARAFLATLAESLPPNAHLVLAGRSSALAAPTIIDENDLRFTDAEVDDIAALAHLPADDLRGLAGWPAALALTVAARTSESRGTAELVHHDTEAGQVASDTIWRSVLAPLPVEHRRALAALSLAGPSDERVVDRLFGASSDQLIDDLLSKVPLCAWRRGRIDVHALWSDPALASLPPKQRRAVPTDVVDALVAVGRFSEAFAIATDHGLHRERSTIVRMVCTDERKIPDALTAGRWADDIDDGDSTLDTAMLRGISLRGRAPRLAAVHLLKAAERARAEHHIALETVALALLGTVSYALADFATGELVQDRARELANTGVDGAAALDQICQVFLDLSRAEPRAALARLAALTAVDKGPLSSLCVFLEARSLCELGRAAEALALLTANEPALRPYHFGTAIIVARCRWMEGDTAAAEALLTREAQSATADGRADDSATLDEFRHMIAALSGRRLDGAPPGPSTQPMALLLRATTDALLALDTDTAPLEGIMRFAYQIGGHAAVIAELRHLLWFVAPDIEQPFLDGTPEIARRVSQAMHDGLVPNSDDINACLHLFPRRFVARIVTRWTERYGNERPPWASSLTADHRAAARLSISTTESDGHDDAGAVPAWLLDPSETVTIRVLGPLMVNVGRAEQAPELRRERVRALLWLLVFRREVTRREAAALLWPSLAPEAAANNLRTTLGYLAKIFDPRGEPAAGLVLDVNRTSIRLRDDLGVVVDAWMLLEQLDRGRDAERNGRIGDALAAHRKAADQWRSDPTTDIEPDEWSDRHLGNYRAAFVEAAVRSSELLLGLDDEEALRLAGRAIDADRWSLRASDIEVRANANLGRDAAARQALVRHRALLAELGVDAGRAESLAGIVARSTAGRT